MLFPEEEEEEEASIFNLSSRANTGSTGSKENAILMLIGFNKTFDSLMTGSRSYSIRVLVTTPITHYTQFRRGLHRIIFITTACFTSCEIIPMYIIPNYILPI